MSIIIYSAEWCSYCKKVKSFLSDKGLPYEDVNVDECPEDMLSLVRQGMKTLPQVFINGQHIGGCDDTIKYFS